MCKVESHCGIPCVAVAVIAACAMSAVGCGKVAFGIAFAGARWGAHDTEIWTGNAVGQVEKPFVSRLR